MDTTKKPTITTHETGGSAGNLIPPANCTWVWSSDSTGRLQVIVDASQNGSGDSIAVNFKVCADKAGNLFDSTGTTGLGIQSYKTQTLFK
jgi:hypothetical protein